MYKIQEAEMLANNIYRMVVEAPRVAQHCLPGQFVIVKADEEGERGREKGEMGRKVEQKSERKGRQIKNLIKFNDTFPRKSL